MSTTNNSDIQQNEIIPEDDEKMTAIFDEKGQFKKIFKKIFFNLNFCFADIDEFLFCRY